MSNYNKNVCTCSNSSKDTKPTSDQESSSSWNACQNDCDTFYDATDVICAQYGELNQSASKLNESSSLTTIMRKISDPQQFRLALKNIAATAEGLLGAVEGIICGSTDKRKNSIRTIMAPKVPFIPSESAHITATESLSGCSGDADRTYVYWHEGMKVCLDPITVTVPLTLYIEPNIVPEENASMWQANNATEGEEIVHISEEPIRTSAIAEKPHELYFAESKATTNLSYNIDEVSDQVSKNSSNCYPADLAHNYEIESKSTSSSEAYPQVTGKKHDLDRTGTAQDDCDGNHSDLSKSNNPNFASFGRQPAVPTHQLQQQQISSQKEEHEKKQQAKENDDKNLEKKCSSDDFVTPKTSFNKVNCPYDDGHDQCCDQSSDLPPPPPAIALDVTTITPQCQTDSDARPTSTMKICFLTKEYTPENSFDCICRATNSEDPPPPPLQQDELQQNVQPPSSILKISFLEDCGDTPQSNRTCPNEPTEHAMYEHTCNTVTDSKPSTAMCPPPNVITEYEQVHYQDPNDGIQSCCQITMMNAPTQNAACAQFVYSYNSNQQSAPYDRIQGCSCSAINKLRTPQENTPPSLPNKLPTPQENSPPNLPTPNVEPTDRSVCKCYNQNSDNNTKSLSAEENNVVEQPTTKPTSTSVGDENATDDKLLPLLESIYEVLQCMRNEQMRLTMPPISSRNQCELTYPEPNMDMPPPPPPSPMESNPLDRLEPFQKRCILADGSRNEEAVIQLSKNRMNSPSWLDSSTKDMEPTMELQEPPERDVDNQAYQRYTQNTEKRLIPFDMDLLRTEEQDGTSVECQVDPHSLTEAPVGVRQALNNVMGYSQPVGSTCENLPDISRKSGMKTISFRSEPGVCQETQVNSSSFEELPPIPRSAQIGHFGFADTYCSREKKMCRSDSSIRASNSDPTTISSESLTGIETYNHTSKYSIDKYMSTSNCTGGEPSCSRRAKKSSLSNFNSCHDRHSSQRHQDGYENDRINHKPCPIDCGGYQEHMKPYVPKECTVDEPLPKTGKFLVIDDSIDKVVKTPPVPPLKLDGQSTPPSDVGTDTPKFNELDNQLAVPNDSISCPSCRKLQDGTNEQIKQKDEFVDSILSDLKVMKETRDRIYSSRSGSGGYLGLSPRSFNTNWEKPPVDLAYPVSIEKVEQLGSDSLFIKWRVHNFKNIAGYEIFLDGRLTNRYFSYVHRAAVICNVDLFCPHRIILRAQPQTKVIQAACSSKHLMSPRRDQRGCASKMLDNPGACCLQPDGTLWYPSVYLFEPKSYVAPVDSD